MKLLDFGMDAINSNCCWKNLGFLRIIIGIPGPYERFREINDPGIFINNLMFSLILPLYSYHTIFALCGFRTGPKILSYKGTAKVPILVVQQLIKQ